MSVHIEGMGWLGTVLAWQLSEARIPFTWHDTDEPITAWRASTGGIYPDGNDEGGQAAYSEWTQWARYQAQWRPYVEAADFWYSTKNPPHGGRYKAVADIGSLRLAFPPSYHVNVQRWVKRARLAFGPYRDPLPSPTVYVVAHGFNQRLLT